MSMSLTADDLLAVKQLIDNSIDERVPAIVDARVEPMLDKLEQRLTRKIDKKINGLSFNIDSLAADMARFSHETTNNFNKLNARVDNLEEKLAVVADMTDYNRVEVRKIKRKLGLE